MKNKLFEAMKEGAAMVGIILGVLAALATALLIGFVVKLIFGHSIVAGIVACVFVAFVVFTLLALTDPKGGYD